jgi:succinate-acetate transporter protein
MEWKKNNMFGMVTFGSFGFFWISFATLLLLPALGLAKAPQPVELAAFLSVWGIFAAGLFICTLKNSPHIAGYVTRGCAPGNSSCGRTTHG